MSGYRDVELLPYLHELEEGFEDIKREVEQLESNYAEIQSTIKNFLYPNPKSKLPRTTDAWMTFGFYALGKRVTELARELGCTQSNENPTDEELETFCTTLDYMLSTVFPRTSEIIDSFFERHKDDVLMIALFRLADQKFLPVHTNYDPFMYRAHMGVLVPEGDIGMMVEGETTRWPEGRFIVFDAMRPHTVWNFTGKARYVLNVDCYRPEFNREDLEAVRSVLVDLRLKESKLTMGLSGGRSDLPMSEKRKYACRHESLEAPSERMVH